MKNAIALLAFACALACATPAKGYQPAKNPLMTEWGEKVTPTSAWMQYPRPHLVRSEWQNLNGLWDYAINKQGDDKPAKWSGTILVPFPVESALSGVKINLEPGSQLWYHRLFSSRVSPGERLLLHFGAVDFRAQVFVNGTEATDIPHEGGFQPFTLDVTPFLKPGDNDLLVSVWDPTDSANHFQAVGKQKLKPDGSFYSRASGIWQTVWLETVPATHITGYTAVTDIDKGTVRIKLQTAGSLAGASASLFIRKGGKTVAEAKLDDLDEPAELKIESPALWSPAHPELYDFEATLRTPAGADTIRGYFGMRKISWAKDEKGVNRLYLNNERTFLMGLADPGWWPDGLLTPPSEDAMAADIAFAKSCGYNLIRKLGKIEPLRYYYLCDTLGILLWQDMPAGWGDKIDRYASYRSDLKDMLDHLQSFPSIIAWIPYNEGCGQPDADKTRQTVAFLKRYDPTRLADDASGWNDSGAGDFHDIHKFPGPDMHPAETSRVSVLGAFGSLSFAVKGHLWNPSRSWGYTHETDEGTLLPRYTELADRLAQLASRGLSAAVYMQSSDVELDINGLVTYDRRHAKFPAAELAKLHAKIDAASKHTFTPRSSILCPDSRQTPQVWSYTIDRPTGNWAEPDYVEGWLKGPGGFGNKAITAKNKAAAVHTVWDTKGLWLRRPFDFDGDPANTDLELSIFYDENADVYINGVKIASFHGFNTSYEKKPIDSDLSRRALRKGRNILAIQLSNCNRESYIDAALNAIIYQ